MEEITILAVDDTQSSLFLLELQLKEWGYKTLLAGSGQEALEILEINPVDLIISDQVMPEMDGIELLHVVKKQYEEIPFIMLTAHGSIDKAVMSIKRGADDYFQKPYNVDELKIAIEHSLSYSRISKENKELKDYLNSLHGFQNIVTESPQMLNAIELAAKVVKSPDTTVAIYGESGSGKEVLARAIHSASDKMESRFIGVNCAGIPSNLLESELFGHVRGAFTGADRDRKGKFDLAQDGTLLLDEIGDMPLDLQAKLLRVLQERTYERVGSNQQIKVNVRIITTTHRDIAKLVKAGKFREDLFHRINSFPITLPPLRTRKGDVPLLVNYFIERFRMELGKNIPGISQAAMDVLVDYHWPGNVRELKNCLERAAILIDKELIKPCHVSVVGDSQDAGDVTLDDSKIRITISLDPEEFSLDSAVGHILKVVLDRCGNNKARAAELLKVSRKVFYRKKQD